MEPIIASDNAETALVPHGQDFLEDKSEYSSSASEEEEEEEDFPPGPVDPEKCSVGGPGTTGGSAQAPVSFYVQARDSRDKKVLEGGDYVVVKVLPGTTAKAAGAVESEAIVKDNNDGSYTATYSVAARGDYELTVEINGSAIGGSPFPVFFSPPEERPLGDTIVTDASGAPVDASTVSAAANAPMPVISIMGADAYAAKVKFPEEANVLESSVLVGNMNPQVTLEQLRQLFSYSGKVNSCEFAGDGNKFALVEFASPKETEQALTLDKLNVIDRQIRVEPAKTALESKGQSGGVQFAALQLQQIQQLQRAQMEQHSLAAQVAQMRVQAKQNPTAFAPGLPQNSASQKAAALSAIAALSKRLTGSSHGAPAPAPTGGSKRRREVSPTLRYRSDRRTRSPPRRRPSPPRRRSPPRRSLEGRPSRDRRRDASRDRRRRSLSPHPRRREHRDRSRDRTHRRHRSRSTEHRSKEALDENGSKEQNGSRSHKDHRRRRERSEREHRSHRKRDREEEQFGSEREAGDNKVDEAQELREKALEAMKSIPSVDKGGDFELKGGKSIEAEVPGSDALFEGNRERRSKHSKKEKHKKEKRRKKDAVDAEDLELPEIEPDS